MKFLLSRLRIGEKIGLGFGLVGAILVVIIWQYDTTLHQVLAEYQELQERPLAKKFQAQAIANALLAAGQAKETYLARPNPQLVAEFNRQLDAGIEQTRLLGRVDPDGAVAATQIEALIEGFRQRFLAMAEAWQIKGLDENSGLQGAFRKRVHVLQQLAGQYEVSDLYITLLQIRRGEKDIALRRGLGYLDQVRGRLDELQALAMTKSLAPDFRDRLLGEIQGYRREFEEYAARALAGQDVEGGKGSYREAAHRMEELIQSQYVPNMEARVLSLRRREKDYLLRLDTVYVERLQSEVRELRQQIDGSGLAREAKTSLVTMIGDYERDFLALVEQNRRLDRLTAEMRLVADQVFAIVKATRTQAEQSARRLTAEVNARATRDSTLMSWLALVASALGVVIALVITRRITRPVLRIAGFLDQLAMEDPTERIPTRAGSRDEIDAMAASVNQLADNKARLLAWWKASMAEMTAAKERLAGSKPGASDPL